MKHQNGMDVKVFAKRAIDGIEAGKQEIRPGLSNVLKAMSRIAPNQRSRDPFVANVVPVNSAAQPAITCHLHRGA